MAVNKIGGTYWGGEHGVHPHEINGSNRPFSIAVGPDINQTAAEHMAANYGEEGVAFVPIIEKRSSRRT